MRISDWSSDVCSSDLIENERDEDLNDGAIPQMPAGHLAILKLNGGVPDCASLMQVDVTGLADIAPEDPEPEFVDINAKGEIALTLQANNHIVIVNGSDGVILRHFSTGTADLIDMETAEERSEELRVGKKGDSTGRA